MVAKTAAHDSVACEPLQDAKMRSRRLTQTIAGSNNKVGRTADPPSMLRELDGGYDDD